MPTLLDLATRMQALAASVPTLGNKAKQVTAGAILNELIEASPVDTSHFVSNWQVSSEVGAEIETFAPGKLGSTRGVSSAATLAAGTTAISHAVPGVPIVIFNAVPYGKYLNDGTSTRAPLGFVERALLVGNQALKAAIGGMKLG